MGGFIGALFIGFGIGLVAWVYKDDPSESKARKLVAIGLVYGLMMFFWIFCILFVFASKAAKDTALAIAYVVVAPLLLGFWAYHVKRRFRRNLEAIRQRMAAGKAWTCPRCHIEMPGHQCTKCGYIPFPEESEKTSRPDPQSHFQRLEIEPAPLRHSSDHPEDPADQGADKKS